jgi:hypothetical protein
MRHASRKLCQLPLLSRNGRWHMRFRGKRVEFVDRPSALRAAILEAFEHSKNGTPTQVVCIEDHLAIEIVWTYGVDPDPPVAPADLSQWSDKKRSAGALVRRPPRAGRMAGTLSQPGDRDRRSRQKPEKCLR